MQSSMALCEKVILHQHFKFTKEKCKNARKVVLSPDFDSATPKSLCFSSLLEGFHVDQDASFTGIKTYFSFSDRFYLSDFFSSSTTQVCECV